MATGDILGVTTDEAYVGFSLASAALGSMATYAFLKSPFHDNGTPIFPTAGPEAFKAVLEVYEANGVRPVRDLSDGDVVRAAMSDKSIVNYSSQHVLDALGQHGGTRMFKADNPLEAANVAQAILVSHGFEDSQVINEPMKDARTKSKMHFVRSEAFPYGELGFRPSIFRLLLAGEKPKKWDPNRIHALEQPPEPLSIFQDQPVTLIETEHVKEGVEADIYKFDDDATKDLAIVRVAAGHKTPLQRIVSGEKTIEGYMDGVGSLDIVRPGGYRVTRDYPRRSDKLETSVNVGDLMQWTAETNLTFYEICWPPYEDGRFENVSE